MDVYVPFVALPTSHSTALLIRRGHETSWFRSLCGVSTNKKCTNSCIHTCIMYLCLPTAKHTRSLRHSQIHVTIQTLYRIRIEHTCILIHACTGLAVLTRMHTTELRSCSERVQDTTLVFNPRCEWRVALIMTSHCSWEELSLTCKVGFLVWVHPLFFFFFSV